ncbi:unnamed protein product [Alopecurus aequalis]
MPVPCRCHGLAHSGTQARAPHRCQRSPCRGRRQHQQCEAVQLHLSLMKEKLEFLDENKCECKLTPIEGGGIGTAIEMATSHIKVEKTVSGGSVVKVESTYKLLPGVEVKDEITKAKDSVTAIFKAAETYLVANPDAYN